MPVVVRCPLSEDFFYKIFYKDKRNNEQKTIFSCFEVSVITNCMLMGILLNFKSS